MTRMLGAHVEVQVAYRNLKLRVCAVYRNFVGVGIRRTKDRFSW
jgi:hypothetical protein